MSYGVEIGDGAQADLRNITEYIAQHESPLRAQLVAARLMERILSLDAFPYRGRSIVEPRELRGLGCREVSVRPFRVIYLVDGDKVDTR